MSMGKNHQFSETKIIEGSIPNNEICDSKEHRFVEGPFWLSMSKTSSESLPIYPTYLMKVEHCAKCGILRLKEEAKKIIGTNFDEDLRLKIS